MTAAPAAGGAAPQPNRLVEQFGGFELLARGNGLQLTYDSPGLTPASPAVQVSVPETLATSSSGSNYALASLAYPGPVLADLPTVLAQTNPDAPRVLPPYPVRSQALFPSGPTEQEQAAGAAVSRATADARSALAKAAYNGSDVGQLVRAASVTNTGLVRVETGRVTSRSRVEASGIDLLGGLIHVDSVVTDLVAVSDGRGSASDGLTTVSGVRVLGVAATIDRDGLRLAEAPADDRAPPGPLAPVVEPVLGPDDPAAGLIEPTRGPVARLNEAISSALGDGATIEDLLDEAGVAVRVLDPVATIDGASATRSAYGLRLDLAYSASGDPQLGPVLAKLAPPGSLPTTCPVPMAPVDCSVDGLVTILTRTQITSVGIGAADVRAAATEPFEPFEVTVALPSLPDALALIDGPSPLGVDPAVATFTTPLPDLVGVGSTGTSTSPLAALGRAIPAILAVLVALGAPLWAIGSRRLADAALADAGATCSTGRDRPLPPPEGP